MNEQVKLEICDKLQNIITFDSKEGLAYRQELLSVYGKRNWKKEVVPWTTLDADMMPEGNNLYLLVLQKYYFDAAEKEKFFETIDDNLEYLLDLNQFLMNLRDEVQEDKDKEWLSSAIEH